MTRSESLSQLVCDKLLEQADRIDHLLTFLPQQNLQWKPTTEALSVGDLLGHLLECFAGVCATLYGAHPQELEHFGALRQQNVNHFCTADEARGRIQEYSARIREGFALLTNQDLGRKIPTVFVSTGEPILTLLLGNLEHLINHKYQFFFYLKLMGVPVGTDDLYALRGEFEQ